MGWGGGSPETQCERVSHALKIKLFNMLCFISVYIFFSFSNAVSLFGKWDFCLFLFCFVFCMFVVVVVFCVLLFLLLLLLLFWGCWLFVCCFLFCFCFCFVLGGCVLYKSALKYLVQIGQK